MIQIDKQGGGVISLRLTGGGAYMWIKEADSANFSGAVCV